jgi:hypothetical protein
MNLKIRRLEEDIVAILNDSDIPIEAKRLVLQNILNVVENNANEIIKRELSQPITEYGEMKDAESARCEQE